jgi:Glucodextranase, domain B
MIRPYEDGKMILKTMVIGIFVLCVCGYGIFQAEKIVRGPEISMVSPASGATTFDNLVHVTGNAQNISAIWLNDRSIYTDEAGKFDEKIMLYSGYNIITVRAQDKFGATVEKKIEVVYKQ